MRDTWGRLASAVRSNRLRRWPWDTITRACDIAASEGHDTVEAEHLLRALTQHADAPTTRALEALGLTEPGVRAALDDGFAEAFRAVGVSDTFALHPASPNGPSRSKPAWGQSATLVLGRALQAAAHDGHGRIGDRHLLIALSQAEAGVIPRVLTSLDITTADIERALG